MKEKEFNLSEKMQNTINKLNEDYLIKCDLEAVELGLFDKLIEGKK